MLTGGCQCGAVRYELAGEIAHHAVCHCGDCRASSGAPMMAWMAVPATGFRITRGEARAYNSSGASHRYFCENCGTGLYFVNEEALPGLVDIQSATLDDAAAHGPQVQIQTAERLEWMTQLADTPSFERWPPM